MCCTSTVGERNQDQICFVKILEYISYLVVFCVNDGSLLLRSSVLLSLTKEHRCFAFSAVPLAIQRCFRLRLFSTVHHVRGGHGNTDDE